LAQIGINATFGSSAPTIPADALHIDGMTFGSSAPFGVNACPSNQPCYIGNQAILGTFSPNATQPVYVNNSNFYRAGTYGVQLDSVNRPVLTGNTFVCNGLGAPTTGATCTGSGPIYSAVYLNEATADLAQGQPPTTGQITGNHGYGNGLDAIAFNGAVVSQTMTWQNATNATSDATNNHWLGYLLTGDLNLANGTARGPRWQRRQEPHRDDQPDPQHTGCPRFEPQNLYQPARPDWHRQLSLGLCPKLWSGRAAGGRVGAASTWRAAAMPASITPTSLMRPPGFGSPTARHRRSVPPPTA